MSDALVIVDKLAQEIRQAHDQCRQAVQRGLEHALEAGRLLLQAKKQRVTHGHWLTWVQGACGLTPRLAQRYMQIARHWEQLAPANATRVSHLTFHQALELLAENTQRLQPWAPDNAARPLEDLVQHDQEMRELGERTARKQDRAVERYMRDRDRPDQEEAALQEEIQAEFPRAPEPPPSEWRLGGLSDAELSVLLDALTQHAEWFDRLDRRLMDDREYPIPRLARDVVKAICQLRHRLTYDRDQLQHAVFGLKDLLAQGPVDGKTVRQWLRTAGISRGLCALAVRILRVVKVSGAGKKEQWQLSRPIEDNQP